MSGLRNSRVIDLIGQDADGKFFLAIVEDRPWGQDPAQAQQLRAKVNAYADAIIGGKIVSLHPETAGRRLEIRLCCAELPPPEISAITEHAKTQLDNLGIDFAVQLIP